MIRIWLKGILATRWPRLLVMALGVVAATALVGTIGAFSLSSASTMTARALSGVPVDWQVALTPGADAAALTAKLRQSVPVRTALTAGYADASAFESQAGGSTQTTGSGQVVGLPSDYARTFPGQMRVLLGTGAGVLLAQQTAANLHATVGDAVTISPVGASPFAVTVDGVVDLPNADAMFQVVGPQKGPSATAPPDNVILLPLDLWRTHFAEAAARPGGGARLQIHSGVDRSRLPSAPDTAYAVATGMARNFEVRAAGEAMVGDNLAARLDAVRQDALFARVLLLFLGLPAGVLALLLTISIVRADAARQQREFALLGLRGASLAQISQLAVGDATLTALFGSAAGGVGALALARAALGVDLATPGVVQWIVGASIGAFLLSVSAIAAPALLGLRRSTIAARRTRVAADSTSPWRGVYFDILLLAIAALVYWRSAAAGYRLVLAPEGVAATAVDYTAFLAPLLFWTGSGLLTYRLTRLALLHSSSWLPAAVRPFSGRLAPLVAASLARQRERLAAGTALVAIAVSFAVAPLLFNATYNGQQLVDARLSNGADVTVTGTTATPAGDKLTVITRVPGVVAAQPMQHRFAYVGKDLQDMFGIDPAHITQATDIVDGYFSRVSAQEALARLAQQSNGVLVSQETVNDFQLAIGDLLNLRLKDARGGEKTISFRFVGVVKEFPTAPRDSFLVANASYIAAQTGDTRAETVLVRASGPVPKVAEEIRHALGVASPLKTTDITQTSHVIGSSLTAVDVASLGAVELGFAILFVAMGSGLTLWLGKSERARANAILLSLGAAPREVRSFVWGEALITTGVGLPIGALIGLANAWILVRLLSGVFDPPPDALYFQWGDLAFTMIGAILAAVAATLAQGGWSKEWAARELRSSD